MGSFYQAVEKIYRYELNRKERPGIFEINLYQAFINKHNAKYGYQVRSVDELIEEAGIDRETKYKYHVRYYNKFQGSNGFLEMAMILINDSDYEAFANLFKQNKFGIIRCEDSRTNYAVQKKFMQIVKPYILAASQNHRFGINQIQKKEMKTNKKYRWNQLKELNLKAKTRESMKSLYYKISPQYRQLWAIREKLDAITFTTNMIDQKVEDTKNHVCTIKENQFKASAFSCYKRLEEQVREYSKNNKHVVLLSPFIFNGIKCCQNYKQVPLRGRERLVLIFLEEKESRVAASYFKKKNVNYVILNVC